MDYFYVVVAAVVLGGVAGGVAASTHQVFISKIVADVKAEVAKFEALKAKL